MFSICDKWEEQDEEGKPLTLERIKEDIELTSNHVSVGVCDDNSIDVFHSISQ